MPDQVPNHRRPRRYSDTYLKLPRRQLTRLTNRLQNRQAAAHRSFRFVLMCVRISEISQNAIAQILRNKSIVTDNCFGATR